MPYRKAELPGVRELRGYVHIHSTVTGELFEPTPSAVHNAKIQTAGVPSDAIGPFTCKLLDAGGGETGGNISVHVLEHLGSNDLDSANVQPNYNDADYMTVYKGPDDNWYTTSVFEDTIDCVCTEP